MGEYNMDKITLNKKHDGSTVINISNNITLKIQCTDLRKECDDSEAPTSYTQFKAYIIYNIFIVVNDRKQKKKARYGHYNDHVGKGNVKDLLKVKDIIFQLSTQLSTNEVIKISGADERRHRIYKYFIEKDIRFEDSTYYSKSDIWIINNFSLLQKFQWNIVTTKDGRYNKKELKKVDKEWKELLI